MVFNGSPAVINAPKPTEILNPFPDIEFECSEIEPFPEIGFQQMAGYLDGKLVTCGGQLVTQGSPEATEKCFSYDFINKNWTQFFSRSKISIQAKESISVKLLE